MPSESIPFGGAIYRRSSGKGPFIETLNRLYEEDPTNQQTQVAMQLRPGLAQAMANVNGGPWRGVHFPPGGFNGDFFAISGAALLRLTRTTQYGLTSTAISGALTNDEFRPSVAFTASRIFVTDGVTLFQSDGTAALAPITAPNGIPFRKVINVAGFIICIERNSQRYYWIEPNAIVINALDFAEAETYTDFLTDATVLGDKFYLFGERSIEPWYVSGDVNAPFARIDGRIYSIGAWPDTVVRIGDSDTVLFVAPDGSVNVLNSAGVISKPDINERIRRAIKSQIAMTF